MSSFTSFLITCLISTALPSVDAVSLVRRVDQSEAELTSSGTFVTTSKDAPMPVRMSQAEEALFRKLLGESKMYVEFGAGGSTVAAVSYANLQHIHVIESDPAWVNKIKARSDVAAAEKAGRLQFHLVDIGPTGAWGNPTSTDSATKTKFPSYSAMVESIASEGPLDLVLVDGRFRVACFLKALKHASPSTRIAVHDYTHRQYYHPIEKYADKVEVAEELNVFKAKANIDQDALDRDIAEYEAVTSLLQISDDSPRTPSKKQVHDDASAKKQAHDEAPSLPTTLTRETYEQYVAKLKKAISHPAPEYVKKFPEGDGRYEGRLAMASNSFDGLKRQIESLVDADLPGDIYETGTWRGGTSIFMVATLRAYERFKGKDSKRQYYGFDSFQGFKQDQTPEDKTLTKHLEDTSYIAPLELVKAAFKRFGVLDDKVHFVKGYFEDTVPHFQVEAPIALLRLDGDLYSSTKVVLENLYPHVQKSAWVIIDDYVWWKEGNGGKAAKQAVDEYRTSQGITSPLTEKFGRWAWKK